MQTRGFFCVGTSADLQIELRCGVHKVMTQLRLWKFNKREA